jgi:hypothetical protein
LRLKQSSEREPVPKILACDKSQNKVDQVRIGCFESFVLFSRFYDTACTLLGLMFHEQSKEVNRYPDCLADYWAKSPTRLQCVPIDRSVRTAYASACAIGSKAAFKTAPESTSTTQGSPETASTKFSW